MIDTFLQALKDHPDVDALVISGSKTGLVSDSLSDWDIYVYSEQVLDRGFRTTLKERFAKEGEVGNDFFGEGDELFLLDDTVVDVMYRSLDWAEAEVKRVWVDHQASVGYSTAFLHNIKTSSILYDRSNRFKSLQEQLKQPYPLQLARAIIDKNYPLLRTKLTASFLEQIEHAIARADYVSCIHRTAALLASYFDVLFALNRQTHPGEKQLVLWARKTCSLLPYQFEETLESVYHHMASPMLPSALDVLLNHLHRLLLENLYLLDE